MNFARGLITVAVAGALGGSAFAQSISGRFQGSVKMPGGQDSLVVVVDLTKNAKGAWVGAFSMPEIGATDITVDKLTVAQPKVQFQVPVLPGSPSFDGMLSSDGKELRGTFTASGTTSPLTMKRVGDAQIKAAPPNSLLPKEFEGTWHGILDPNNAQIRVLLKLSRAADGTALGIVTNVDQGNRDIPINTIAIKDKILDFEIRSVAIHFHGTLAVTGRTIAGEWSQLTNKAQLTFEKGGFPPNSPMTSAFEGTWQGSIDAGSANKVTLSVKLSRGLDGASVGTIRNTSEAGKEMQATTINLKNRSIEMTFSGLQATFSGTLNAAGNEISGTWVIAGTGLPLTFKRIPATASKP